MTISDHDLPEVPATQQPVNADRAPDFVDTEPTEEDGPQDVDQDTDYEEAEADDTSESDDPEVHEVG